MFSLFDPHLASALMNPSTAAMANPQSDSAIVNTEVETPPMTPLSPPISMTATQATPQAPRDSPFLRLRRRQSHSPFWMVPRPCRGPLQRLPSLSPVPPPVGMACSTQLLMVRCSPTLSRNIRTSHAIPHLDLPQMPTLRRLV